MNCRVHRVKSANNQAHPAVTDGAVSRDVRKTEQRCRGEKAGFSGAARVAAARGVWSGPRGGAGETQGDHPPRAGRPRTGLGGGVRGRLRFVWVSGASHGPGTSVGNARPPWHGGRPDRGGTATSSLELREDGETGRPAGAQPAPARPRSPFLQPRAGDTRFPPSPAPRGLTPPPWQRPPRGASARQPLCSLAPRFPRLKRMLSLSHHPHKATANAEGRDHGKTVRVTNKPFNFSDGVLITNHPQISGVATWRPALAPAPGVEHPGFCAQPGVPSD